MSYPEHEKLRALDGANDTVGEFIDWLHSKGMAVGEWGFPVDMQVVVDPGKVEMGRGETRELRELAEGDDPIVVGEWLEAHGYEDALVARNYPTLDMFDKLITLPDPEAAGCRWTYTALDRSRMWPTMLSPEKLIGMFFDIDPVKLSAEKDAMLDAIRAVK